MSVGRGRFAVLGLALAGVVVAAACFSEHSTPTAPNTPTTPTTNVGDIFFTSALNGSSNPAVDTVAVGGTVTWTWAAGEVLPHSVRSLGSPSFTSSGMLSGAGNTYQFTFTAPGTYQYDCAVHGQLMTGSIVVLAAAATTSPSDTATAPATPSTPERRYAVYRAAEWQLPDLLRGSRARAIRHVDPIQGGPGVQVAQLENLVAGLRSGWTLGGGAGIQAATSGLRVRGHGQGEDHAGWKTHLES